MRFSEAFRDPALAEKLFTEIARTAETLARSRKTPVTVMEVCGGHTHTIFRYGLKDRLPDTIEFAHGPGCPVCVLPMGRIDDAIALARRPDVILTTFGDAMRVPGAQGSLLQARAAGADIRMVYSPLDALELARKNPDREIVFFALGFETTAPSTALTVLRAAREGIQNFSLLCQHILIVPTLRALLEQPDFAVDGFIGPGHVAMVTGTHPYEFVASTFHRPFVVAGFEPLDILQSLLMVLRQLEAGQARVENQYARVVPPEGNPAALAAMRQVYETRPDTAWRGLGTIAFSGLQLRPTWAAFDAERRFALTPHTVADPASARCGDVLTGRIRPTACPAFGRDCTPDAPLGALMVSSEGACAACYDYEGARQVA
ncbi:hydrogenase formation protein HypD [Acetobacter suratthaniensis]|uniref:Hydrogenase maturation factor n=1 Tax=Acetobacter suratthaniensis TaxID=1502841 RepID=A0ABS3LLC5_9PROT|nr:hydrogenase formation protein HypD [Acetobacter suratthaniensis]MBO1328166.1 hydrogenase formation protein HypD [Acetobacter suratthaniensis]MCX2566286.1 hydrogenase formation protein HypD [Acetobacter suratthaniensis]